MSVTTSRRLQEYHLFPWIPVGLVLLVFIGFAQTWVLKSLVGTPVLPLLLHLHGLVMSAWVVLFAVQTRLVATHRVDLHRRLGIAGAVLLILVPVMGVVTAIHAAKLGHSPGPPPLVFLSVPLFNILAFAILAGSGLALRKRRDWHRRLMLAATLNFLPPAVGRIAQQYTHIPNLPMAFGSVDVVLLACVVYDTIRNRRLHPAFVLGLVVTLAWQAAVLAFGKTAGWAHVAAWLVSLT
jgi:hypothetical protein